MKHKTIQATERLPGTEFYIRNGRGNLSETSFMVAPDQTKAHTGQSGNPNILVEQCSPRKILSISTRTRTIIASALIGDY